MTTQDYAHGLRQIAEWYARHPEIPPPGTPEVTNFLLEDWAMAQTVARALGHATKTFAGVNDELFKLTRWFGTVPLEFFFLRQAVCTRRVVGTEEVPEVVIPAHTRELVEWECEAVLALEGPNPP